MTRTAVGRMLPQRGAATPDNASALGCPVYTEEYRIIIAGCL